MDSISNSKKDHNNNTADASVDVLSSLSELLTALAQGVRSVQSLPTDDDFALEESVGGRAFGSALRGAHGELLDCVQAVLRQVNNDANHHSNDWTTDVADPFLWEACADVCDDLQELAQAQLTVTSSSTNHSLTRAAQTARQTAQSKLGRLVENTVEMDKPQLRFARPHDNRRSQPFVPAVHPDKPHAVVPLDLTLQDGTGYTSQHTAVAASNQWITASQHVPHVYRTEILQLAGPPPPPYSFTRPLTEKIPPIAGPLKATWIDQVEPLHQLAAQLNQVSEFAMDLEAHSYRSFAGFCCLMQITYRTPVSESSSHSSSTTATTKQQQQQYQYHNFLIDTLALHDDLNAALAAPLANPAIVKVLHGADSDILWLQRDFGLFVVNLWDTGRAARALQFPSAGYAHLLQRYAGIYEDKAGQLADWRVRPLSPALQQYAIQDTHYLLDIYDRLRYDLQQANADLLKDVFEASRQVSLQQYLGEPFKPNGYLKLLNGHQRSGKSSRSRTQLTPTQQAVLKHLWDWRDATARLRDESVPYVCTNPALIRLALSSPTTVAALQSLWNPLPAILLECATDILQAVQRGLKEAAASASNNSSNNNNNNHRSPQPATPVNDDDSDDEADREVSQGTTMSSAFFKPARDGLVSPVLGTEALYKQAGWTTPAATSTAGGAAHHHHVTSSSATEGEDNSNNTAAMANSTSNSTTSTKPKRLLSVHPSNQDYRAVREEAGRSTDGMATVRAVPASKSRSAAAAAAAKQAVAVHKQSIPVVLGMISPGEPDEVAPDGSKNKSNVASNNHAASTNRKTGAEDDTADDKDFAIPRSMKEIYKISNRNRRNKKAGSPTPSVPPQDDEALERAEAVLRERGHPAYFDEASSPKRPRRGRDSEECVPSDASSNQHHPHNQHHHHHQGGHSNNNNNSQMLLADKEEDKSFMKEIGWIKDEKDAADLMTASKPMAVEESSSSQQASSGLLSSSNHNPYFAGAAVAGGPLTQGFSKPNSRKPNKGKQGRRQQERPEKKDGRTHAYRKR